MDVIEMIAVQSVLRQHGEKWEDVVSAHRGFPKLTSGATATFNVRVETKSGAYTVPVTTRVSYTDPLVLEDA